jgi:hypothetical protein
MAMPPDDPGSASNLLRALFRGREEVPPDGCPDENALAGYAERALLPAERVGVEAHLARCGRCRATVAGVVTDLEQAGALARRGPVLRVLPWLAVAAAAAAVLWLALLPGQGGRGGQDPPSVSEWLARAGPTLRRADPEVFAAFEPLDRAERLAAALPMEDVLRSGRGVLLSPRHRIRDRRPAFAWQRPVDVTRFQITVLDATSGAPAWQTEMEIPGENAEERVRMAYPAHRPELPPGKWVWEVSFRDFLGPVRADASFEVLGDEDARRVARGLDSIDARVGAPVADLLKAHFLIRAGLFVEAEGPARRYLDAAGDAVGRETLFHVLERLGAPGARDVLGE